MTVLKAAILAIFALWAAESVAAQTSETPPVESVVVSERADASRNQGEILVAANGAYEQGDYAAAIGNYRKLIDKGAASGKVHFNLGNAYLRHGELGRAIAHFRRGRNLLPRDEDIRANLTFARETGTRSLHPSHRPSCRPCCSGTTG